MDISVKIDVDTNELLKKIDNPTFGTFAASEWKRLIDPFTPRDTGQLMGLFGDVTIEPWEIHYNAQNNGYYYSERVYYGTNLNFRKINPFATHHWDEAAEAAGKKEDLEKTLTNALNKGIY